MEFKFSQNIGFTLVELLVVIAIIGILSSVAVVNLNSARDKARVAAIQQTLSSLRPVVLLCFNNEQELLCAGNPSGDPCVGVEAPDPTMGYYVCNGSSTPWPDIATQYDGWGYCYASSNAAAGTYSFGVGSDGGGDCSTGTTIICTQETCSVSS